MAPATRATRNTPQKATDVSLTPRKMHPSKRIGELIQSPMRIQSPFHLVKKVLTGTSPDTLVSRDDEYTKISSLIKTSLLEKKSIALYISGGPGTGKTLTVNHVIDNLKMNYKFKTLTINCMHIESSKDFYEHFTSKFGSSPKKAKRNTTSDNSDHITKIEEILKNQTQMTILVLDEIDQLKSNTNEALRRIFTLPNNIKNNIILIGISNLLDFTSKMTWLTEFTKSTFHDLKFLPYTKEQIVNIIDQRLRNAGNNENNVVDKFAIEYCARKISACSGDIRKALDVCRRAVELVEAQNRNIQHSPNKNNGSSLPLAKRLFNDHNVADEAPKPQVQERVDVRTMMTALNKVYGGVVDKLDDDKKIFLPADQQLILAVMLVLFKVKKLRDVKLSDLRLYMSKICSKRNISCEYNNDAQLLSLSRLLEQHGYLSVVNDNTSMSCGRSPAKRTPNKKKQLYLSLRLESSEIEQLLGAFYKNIVNEAERLIS